MALVAGAGCDGSGGTLTVAAAEDEIETAVTAVADGLGLEDRRERPLRSRVRCEVVTGDVGARNAMTIEGSYPGSDDPLARGARMIAEAGFELVDSGLDDTVYGRREGMRVTVVVSPTGRVSVDGATGCRPLR